MTLLAVLITLGIAQISQARIGFTREQCDAQYGTPIKVEQYEWGAVVTYKKNGISIEVWLDKQRMGCEYISYTVDYGNDSAVKDPDGQKFTDEVLRSLLELNSEGGDWVLIDEHKKEFAMLSDTVFSRSWRSSKGGEAEFGKVVHFNVFPMITNEGLSITSAFRVADLAEREKKKKNQEKEQKATEAKERVKGL